MKIRCAKSLTPEKTYKTTLDSVELNTTREGKKFVALNLSHDGIPVRTTMFWVNNEIAEEIFCNQFASQFDDLYAEYKSLKDFLVAANKHKGDQIIIRYIKETWTVSDLAGVETEHSRFAPCIDIDRLMQEDPGFFAT